MRTFVGSGLWVSIALVGALSGTLLGACGTDIGMRDPSDDDGSGGEEVSGEELFRENCAMCHGADGGGSMDGPQVLNPVKQFATYTVRNGRDKQMGYRDAMPAFGDDVLSDAELSRVIDFLASAPKPTTGEGLYVRFCGNCHGANAQGGRVGQDVTHELDEIGEKVREGHGGTNYAAYTKYMPSWTSAELTDAEVDLIAAYLATLPPGPGDDEHDDD